jgi:hypothetical protein
MWVLIVVLAFYQRGPQPEVQMHDFTSQITCEAASDNVRASIKETLKDVEGHNSSADYRVYCVRK